MIKRMMILAGFIVLTNALGAVTPAEARKNLQMNYSSVCIEGEDCVSASASATPGNNAGDMGELFGSKCGLCHNSGLGGAPRIDEGGDWVLRLGKGQEGLLRSLTNGLGAMPAKGGCFDCSDEDLSGLIDYVIARLDLDTAE